MAKITKEAFGELKNGRLITLYTLENNGGMRVRIMDYGARVQSLIVPDREGKSIDVALGYDDLKGYEADDKYLGAIVGRSAGRIAFGDLPIDDERYVLECNEGRNHLHGGSLGGYDKKVWAAEEKDGALVLRYLSPAGEGGYPGDLKLAVTYALSEKNEFVLSYEAEADGDTICNPSHHTYFNLEGFSSGSVLDHKIRIFAEKYTPTDNELIPDGRVLLVEGTPLDFREMKEIGARIDAPFSQMRWAGGYDHNWVLRGDPAPAPYAHLKKAARVTSAQTGLALDCWTTQPGLQFYTANALGKSPLIGKGGAPYTRRSAFCLETQFFPNAFAHPHFPQPILREGEVWTAETVYRLSEI